MFQKHLPAAVIFFVTSQDVLALSADENWIRNLTKPIGPETWRFFIAGRRRSAIAVAIVLPVTAIPSSHDAHVNEFSSLGLARHSRRLSLNAADSLAGVRKYAKQMLLDALRKDLFSVT